MTATAKKKTHTEQKNVEIKMAKRKGQSSDAAGVHLSSHPRLASISKVSPHAAATGRLPASPRGGCRLL
jgi:hypothetical protein